MQTLTVARRFRGPTTSANGGYLCGLVAALTREPSTVRLQYPPPLDTDLVVTEGEGGLELRHGEIVVAETRHGEVGQLEPPPAPSRQEAGEAGARFAGLSKHFAPECFVCGPKRAQGDGLRIFCGSLGRDDIVAGPWVPDGSLDDGNGQVLGAHLWAALDCPGYAALAPEMRPMLLGELTAQIERPVEVGEPCIVVGWRIGGRGRKHEAGTALYGADGDLAGLARAIWIEPRSA